MLTSEKKKFKFPGDDYSFGNNTTKFALVHLNWIFEHVVLLSCLHRFEYAKGVHDSQKGVLFGVKNVLWQEKQVLVSQGLKKKKRQNYFAFHLNDLEQKNNSVPSVVWVLGWFSYVKMLISTWGNSPVSSVSH